jgi:hypothetical protein
MKATPIKNTIELHWEPEVAFRIPLQRAAPLARRAPETTDAFPFGEEPWRTMSFLT